MRLQFVIHSLNLGGAQRVVSTLANHWAGQGWDVGIVTLDDGASFYTLDERIRVQGLDLRRDSSSPLQAVCNNVRRLRTLRRVVVNNRPDVVVAFVDQTNMLALLALAGSGLPVVVSERTDPRRHDIGRVWSGLRRLTYPLARALVVQTTSIRDFFPARVRRKTVIIPNPLTPAGQDGAGALPALPRPCVVAMGRLGREKGFDLLLAAFARVAGAHPAWHLVILGEGRERAALQAQRAALGLEQRIHLPGAVSPASAALQQADAFVLSSRREGFPNALLEAIACGLPAIATTCSSGPAEIVHDGENGLLVPSEDPASLAAALDRLLGDAALRARLGRAAAAAVKPYALETIAARWETLLEQVRR